MATSANTTTNTQSIDVLGLQPNQNYIIKVYAVRTASDGTVTHSDYSIPLNITTPAYAPGGNFVASNNGTDIQLNGGSLFAGTFGKSPGLINVVTDTVDGTGVILNQTGLAGYNSGTQEFYLDAATGNAYFAGTIGATIIESTAYSPTDPIDGSAYASAGSGMAINLANGSITSEQFRIDTSGNAFFAGAVGANATINGTLASTVVSNAATGITKNVTFTQSTQPTALNIGDLWYDTGHGYKSYRWDGTTWVNVQDTSIATALTASLAAQTSASGKNTIIYGAKTPPSPYSSDVTYGQAPNLTYYQITPGTTSTSVNTTTGAVTTTPTTAINTFPQTINNTTYNIAGDTWFVLNINGSVIAQYTVSSDATQWVWTTVSNQVIGNIDAGKITSGTLSAVNINNNTGTFAVDTYGNLKATSAYISGAIVGSTVTGSSISNTVNTSMETPQDFGRITISTDTSTGTGFGGSRRGRIVLDSGYGTRVGAIQVYGRTVGSSSTSYVYIYPPIDSNNIPSTGNSQLSIDSAGGFVINGTPNTSGSTDSYSNMSFIMYTQNGNVSEWKKNTLNIASDPGTTPSGGAPGDMWLYY